MRSVFSHDFLRGNLAWTIQAIESGKNPVTLRKEMLRLARSTSTGNKVHYKPGTRLVREWQGETYDVTILDKGYRWQERHYRSLSRIAEEITGTRWSGPRFFGLGKNP